MSVVGALLWHGGESTEVVRSLRKSGDRRGFSPVVSHLYEAIQQEKSDMRGLSTKDEATSQRKMWTTILYGRKLKRSIAASQLLIRELPQTSEIFIESRTRSDYDLYRTSTALCSWKVSIRTYRFQPSLLMK